MNSSVFTRRVELNEKKTLSRHWYENGVLENKHMYAGGLDIYVYENTYQYYV